MQDKSSPISEKTSPKQVRRMRTADDVVEEMHGLCRRLASPAEPGEKLKTIYGRLAKAGGVSWREAKKYWHRERKLIPGHVVDNFRQAVEAHERQTQRLFAERQSRRDRYYSLTDHSMDTEFYSQRVGEVCGPVPEHPRRSVDAGSTNKVASEEGP